MAHQQTPSTMRVWKYASAVGGIENHLKLHTSDPLPKRPSNRHLIQVLAVGLNPVDFKPAEAPVLGRLAIKFPATPGFDIVGRVVVPADGSDLEPGEIVFGAADTNPLAAGGLAEYVAAPADLVARLPAGFAPVDAAGVAVAGLTAYDSIIPYIKSGSRIFMNGGSGGVGTFAIQVAKAVGAHVTVSCSARNAELCRSLGADEVLDYNAAPLLGQLQKSAPFDHVADYVCNDPALYFQAHTYTTPDARFIEVASGPNWNFIRFAITAFLLPSFLGGGQRKFITPVADVKREKLERVASWAVEGKLKVVKDQVFPFQDAVDAFKRLKTGRASGKVIVNVAVEGQ